MKPGARVLALRGLETIQVPKDNTRGRSLGLEVAAAKALLVFLFVLIALLLYKYRHKRHIHAFLARFTKASPYSDLKRKRSSMGGGLLFTDGHHGDALIMSEAEKRMSSFGYGTPLLTP
ncbi:hypothetical protein N0V88_006260 [Collariella sp. IMI 366227]|nr:hypothetical protein N0V88_006260 [Collariella sp. IMI 366227]